MDQPTRVSFVGTGVVSKTLAGLTARSADFVVGDVVSRSMDHARAAIEFIGSGTACSSYAALTFSELWVVAVRDSAIVDVARQLASSGVLRCGDTVIHCSGAADARLLEACKKQGAATGTMHPIRSFADPRVSRDEFRGTVCAAEEGSEDAALISAWIGALGGVEIGIPAAQKLRYHAGHVFACNYLVSLLETALAQFEAVGIERSEALAFVLPLMEGTLSNVKTSGVEAALTGPIARGDLKVVKAQLEAIPEGGERSLYRELGKQAVRVARRGGTLDDVQEKLALELLASSGKVKRSHT